MSQENTAPEGQIYSDFTRSYFYRGDFLKQISRRVKRDIRSSELLKPDQTYSLVEDGRLSTAILKKLLKDIFADRLDLRLIAPGEDVKGTLLNSDCMDEYIQQRLDVFLQGEGLDLLTDQTPTPLRVVSAHECKLLGEIYELQGEPPQSNSEFVEALQGKYDQTKTSLLKSFTYLQVALQNRKNSE